MLQALPIRIFILTFFLYVTACAPLKVIKANETDSIHGWQYTLPRDMIKYKSGLITNIGAEISSIYIDKMELSKLSENLNKKVGDVNSKVVIDQSILPSELAEHFFSSLKESDLDNVNWKLIENKPIKLMGENGFYIRMSYNNLRGAPYLKEVYGTKIDDNIVYFTHTGLKIYHFDSEKPDFDNMIASLKKE